jgi:xylose isomerase
MSYFEHIPAVRYEGPQSDNPLAFHHYDRTRRVLGKTLEEHLRIAVCYWHTFVWPGVDIFGEGTFARPWQQPGDPMERAHQKADAAFEFFSKLGTPYYTFHDTDVAPDGSSLKEYSENFTRIADYLARKQQDTGVKLLWGTANLFSHRRYAGGAATNPNPDVFAFAATQVRHALDATQRLGGENYVLWGGREGYETLLNTDLKRERDQFARFLSMVVEHSHKIGFKGTLLIEPKPQEPTKHQYDYDVRKPCTASSRNTACRTRFASTSRPITQRSRDTRFITRLPRHLRSASSAASTRIAATRKTAGIRTSFRTASRN